MAGESAKPTPGFLNRPMNNSNNVHELIKRIQSAKATGKFTYNAGRADRIINVGIGLFCIFAMANVGRGVHQLAYGYGKKEGF